MSFDFMQVSPNHIEGIIGSKNLRCRVLRYLVVIMPGSPEFSCITGIVQSPPRKQCPHIFLTGRNFPSIKS
jgi:hypothetical protein